jgi:electron transport complex protein RnfD
MTMPGNFVVSASPHVRTPLDTGRVMRIVFAALLPTAVASVFLFGLHSLVVIVTAVVTCVATEWACNRAFGKEPTCSDGSAAVSGILFAFTLPPTTPFWMVIIGAVLAIFVVKELFGGLGYNIFNPALAARAILLASWPFALTTWAKPTHSFLSVDAVTTATQLGLLKEAQRLGNAAPETYGYLDLFLGHVPGSLGETCKLTLLAGALVLFLLKIIDWRIPLSFIGAVTLLSLCFGRDPLAAVLSGGVILGAFFMATDLVTSPSGRAGKLVFGAGCGALTATIRSYGGFPEGVCYSILFMNCLTPLIDKYLQPRIFGTRKGKA